MLGKILLALPLCLLLSVQNIAAQEDAGIVTEQFKHFCSQYRFNYMNSADYTPEVYEKDRLIEIKKEKLTIQFSGYEMGEAQNLFLFSSYRDTCCGSPEITSGCYVKENEGWKDVTTEVMPELTYKDFYGRDVAPPSQYLNSVQFRYVLHKNNQVQVVIEPKGKFDEKFLRVFEARKYAAVQLKWNRKAGKFEIQKWLK
jgi:hypothetical protein